MEVIQAQEAPVVEAPKVEAPITEAPKVEQPDIISRVSQPKPVQPQGEQKFNINDLDSQIEKLTDPILKEQVMGLKKSLLRGENQKYQEIADLRKQYEQELAKVSTWTPERLQAELKKQDFIQAAQSIVAPQSDSSLLTEPERRMLEQNNQQVQALLQQNQQLLKSQQEAELKKRYADYDPVAVDKFVQDFQSGKRQASYEDAWILINYKNMVQRAYELGREEIQNTNREKVAGMSFAAGSNIPSQPMVERQKGETAQQFFQRAYATHTKK